MLLASPKSLVTQKPWLPSYGLEDSVTVPAPSTYFLVKLSWLGSHTSGCTSMSPLPWSMAWKIVALLPGTYSTVPPMRDVTTSPNTWAIACAPVHDGTPILTSSACAATPIALIASALMSDLESDILQVSLLDVLGVTLVIDIPAGRRCLDIQTMPHCRQCAGRRHCSCRQSSRDGSGRSNHPVLCRNKPDQKAALRAAPNA